MTDLAHALKEPLAEDRIPALEEVERQRKTVLDRANEITDALSDITALTVTLATLDPEAYTELDELAWKLLEVAEGWFDRKSKVYPGGIEDWAGEPTMALREEGV